MKKQDLTNIKNVLEKKLNQNIINIRQFKRGASSHNYLVETAENKLLIKIAWKHKKKGVERIAKIILALQETKNFPIAKIIPINKKTLFKIENSYGFCLEYVNGKSIPSYKFKPSNFQTILDAYDNLSNIKWNKIKNELVPAYEFNNILNKYIKNTQLIQKKLSAEKSLLTPVALCIIKKVLSELNKIKNTPLYMNKNKICVIHGDFHNNNILFNQNKLLAFIDFEDVGFGYKTEDLIRFILCLTARLPLFVNKQKRIEKLFELIQKKYNFDYEELMIGLNSFTIQKFKKIIGKPSKKINVSYLKKCIQILWFMRTYNDLEKKFKNYCR